MSILPINDCKPNQVIQNKSFKFNANAIEYVPLIKNKSKYQHHNNQSISNSKLNKDHTDKLNHNGIHNLYDIEKEEFKDQTLPWNTIENDIGSYSYFLSEYTLGNKFTSGGQGELYKCRIKKMNNALCCIKIYKFKNSKQKFRIYQEYMMVSKLRNLDYLDICFGKNNNEIYLIMVLLQATIPLMIGITSDDDIYNFNYQPNGLNIKYLIIEISGFLHSMHRSGYIHLDIKPSNCMLRNDCSERRVMHGNGFKLIDFGSCKYINPNKSGYIKLDRFHGTPGYNAPEMKRNPSKKNPNIISCKTDIFSFGILLLYVINDANNIFSSKKLQKNSNSFVYFHKIIKNKNNFNAEIADKIMENYLTKLYLEGKINTELKQLLSNMLKYNQENRLSAFDIINYSWFAPYIKMKGNKYGLKAMNGRYCSPKFMKYKYHQLF